MPDINVRQFVRAVQSATLLGMAQKAGVKTSPPPISGRNLVATRTFNSRFPATDRPLGGAAGV
ncbi:MAG: hypothetical protein ABI165_15040, partial [Bryobacteraceae bacterium]